MEEAAAADQAVAAPFINTRWHIDAQSNFYHDFAAPMGTFVLAFSIDIRIDRTGDKYFIVSGVERHNFQSATQRCNPHVHGDRNS